MPKTIMMKIEIDNKVKKDADKLFKELGLDTNTATAPASTALLT